MVLFYVEYLILKSFNVVMNVNDLQPFLGIRISNKKQSMTTQINNITDVNTNEPTQHRNQADADGNPIVITPPDVNTLEASEHLTALTFSTFLKSLSSSTPASTEMWTTNTSLTNSSPFVSADSVIARLVTDKEQLLSKAGVDENFCSVVKLLNCATTGGEVPSIPVGVNFIDAILPYDQYLPYESSDSTFIRSSDILATKKARTLIMMTGSSYENSTLSEFYASEIAADSTAYIRGQGAITNYAKLKHHETELAEHRRVFVRNTPSDGAFYHSNLLEVLGTMRAAQVSKLLSEVSGYALAQATVDTAVATFQAKTDPADPKKKLEPSAKVTNVDDITTKKPAFCFMSEKTFLAAVLATTDTVGGVPASFFDTVNSYERTGRYICFVSPSEASRLSFVLGLMVFLFDSIGLNSSPHDHGARMLFKSFSQIIFVVQGDSPSYQLNGIHFEAGAWYNAKDLVQATCNRLKNEVSVSFGFTSKADVANALSFWGSNGVQYTRPANDAEQAIDLDLGLEPSHKVFKWWETVPRRLDDTSVSNISVVQLLTSSFWTRWAFKLGYVDLVGATVSSRITYCPGLLLELARPYSALCGAMVDSLAGVNGIPMSAYSGVASTEGGKNQILSTLVTRLTSWSFWSVADGPLVRKGGKSSVGAPSLPSGWNAVAKDPGSEEYRSSFGLRPAASTTKPIFQCFVRTWWQGACSSVVNWNHSGGISRDDELSFRYGQEKETSPGFTIDANNLLKRESTKKLLSGPSVAAALCTAVNGESALSYALPGIGEIIQVRTTTISFGANTCSLPCRVPSRSGGQDIVFNLTNLAKGLVSSRDLLSTKILNGASAGDRLSIMTLPIGDLDLDFA